MVRTAKRIDSTDACDTSTYSIAIIEVPNLSLVSVDIGNRQPSTTLTTGFFTRDPIGFGDGLHLYGLKIGLSKLDSTGAYVQDAFGNWCCEGDVKKDCCVTIKIRKPCRPVAVQIAANLLAGLPAQHGVNSEHSWLDGSCDGKFFRLGLGSDPRNPGQGVIRNEGPIEQQFGVSHKKSFCGLCGPSFQCMFVALGAALRNPQPAYCLLDPYASGCQNCASFVTDALRGCGMAIPHGSDPWQLARGAEEVGPCGADQAGVP